MGAAAENLAGAQRPGIASPRDASDAEQNTFHAVRPQKIRDVPGFYSRCTLKVFLCEADCSFARLAWT